MTPQVQREAWVCATQDGDEVVLEGLDRPFGGIASVIVGGDELKIDALLTKIALEAGRGFIVKTLVLGGEATVDKVLVDTVEDFDVFQFGVVAKGGSQNCIAIVDVADEDVLVALAGGDGEATSEIGGDFVAWTRDGREHQVCFGVGDIRGGREILLGGNREAGGPKVHVLLVLMSHDGDNGFG